MELQQIQIRPKPYLYLYQQDPVSIFGGVIALNSPITSQIAEELTSLFLECVVAPQIEADACKILQKKKNLRVLIWSEMCKKSIETFSTKDILGGYVLQSEDQVCPWSKTWQVLGKMPSDKIHKAIAFAWKTVTCLKSNAIAITCENQTLGLGMGQTNRIDAACMLFYVGGHIILKNNKMLF